MKMGTVPLEKKLSYKGFLETLILDKTLIFISDSKNTKSGILGINGKN